MSEGAVLNQVPQLLGGDDHHGGERRRMTESLGVVRGRRAVAAMHGMLVELSSRTGQQGAMDAFDIFLDSPSAREKIPYLLLIGLREDVSPESARAGDVDAAVLIYEYRVAGRGIRVFATDDVAGERTVVARQDDRIQAAEIACRHLAQVGAIAVLISLELPRHPEGEPWRAVSGPEARCRIALRNRLVPRYLPLASSYESTLATLGDDTRRNFRRYRRRLVNEFGVEFVPEVAMEYQEFLRMNRSSTNPLSQASAAWRFRSLGRAHQPVFCGLRSADGRWLSLLGGRRRPGLLEIDWQMNLAGMPRYSLSTVMRAFLVESEVARGTRKLFFEGGTPHPMRYSFECVSAVDIVVQRRSTAGWLMRKLPLWVFPENNFLSHALRDENMQWRDWKRDPRVPQAPQSQSSASPNLTDAA
jgi:hypothetical protein